MRERFHCSGAAAIHPYSLVEMLMVLAIIAILAGLGAGGYTVARRWLSQSRTEALLSKLKIALESYKNDKGYYPLPQGSVVNFRLDVNANDYHASATLPSPDDHLQPRNNMSNFMDFGKLRTDQSLRVNQTDYYEYFLKDGWNSPAVDETFGAIKYRCPGVINTTSFDLYSAGYDRTFNTEDDIYAK